MKYNQVSITLFFIQSVFNSRPIQGIRKLPDLRMKEKRTHRDMNIFNLGEDYSDNQRKNITARYVHFNAKYKTYRSKPDRSVTFSYYDEAPTFFKYKYQPIIGDKIVAIKDVKVRRRTSKLFDNNDPLTDISQNVFNENDSLLSNTLENSLKIDPILEVPKSKSVPLVRRPHRYFSKLYKSPLDDIDDPLKDMTYMLKDFSPETDQNHEGGGKIRLVTNELPKKSDHARHQNVISRKRNYRNRYFINSGHASSSGMYKLHPDVKTAKDISFILQENYMPEDEFKFISVNEPKTELISNDITRPKEEHLINDGYFVDNSIKSKKPQKHFTDLYNIETKNKDKVVSLANSTDSDSMTVKIWKALQNIKNWMDDN